jgi:hypothetical protein
MVTLIRVETRGGQILGRCNESCYNANRENPACICGGINAGVGHAQAKKNLPRVIAALAKTKWPEAPIYIRLHPGTKHAQLWDIIDLSHPHSLG